MIPEETQIIDGKLYTKPPVPREILESEVQAWMDAAVAQKASNEEALARAVQSRTDTIAQLDSTVDKFTSDIASDDVSIATLQSWLDTFQ